MGPMASADAATRRRRSRSSSALHAKSADAKTADVAAPAYDNHIQDRDPMANKAQRERENMTALQKHCAYFDRDGDGVVSPGDTYKGFRALGCNPLICAAAVVLVCLFLAPPTSPHWYPTWNVHLRTSHRSIHGSDTGVYDEGGEFDEAKFNALFEKYDLDRDDALNIREFLHRARAQRDHLDFFGQIATILEFSLTYVLAGENWTLTRETLRTVYDGTFFDNVEARAKAKRESGALYKNII